MSTAAADQKLRRMTHTAQRRRRRRGSRAGPPLARRARGQRRRARAAPAAARPVQAALCVPPRAACCDRAQRFKTRAAKSICHVSRHVAPRRQMQELITVSAMSNDRQSSMTNFERPLIPRARIQGPGCTAHRAEARRHAGLRAVGPARAHLHSFDSGCVLARAMLSIVRACLHAMCCPRVTRAPHPRRCITWMVDLAQAYSSGRRRTPGGRPRRRTGRAASVARAHIR